MGTNRALDRRAAPSMPRPKATRLSTRCAAATKI